MDKTSKNSITHGANVVVLPAEEVDYQRVIAGCATEFELFRVCDRIANDFQHPYFSVIRLPQEGEMSLAQVLLLSNWPALAIAEYDELALLEHSPVVRHLRRSTEPRIFQAAELNRSRPSREQSAATGLLERYGMGCGVFFSVHSPKGDRGAVHFAGKGGSPDRQTVMELSYLANLIFARLLENASVGSAASHELKDREIECLRWTSQGKTSGEISTIIGLSEHTVNHYLANATRKLDAQNRTHAVSKAFRMGIIR